MESSHKETSLLPDRASFLMLLLFRTLCTVPAIRRTVHSYCTALTEHAELILPACASLGILLTRILHGDRIVNGFGTCERMGWYT
jgi:hypothetical protein